MFGCVLIFVAVANCACCIVFDAAVAALTKTSRPREVRSKAFRSAKAGSKSRGLGRDLDCVDGVVVVGLTIVVNGLGIETTGVERTRFLLTLPDLLAGFLADSIFGLFNVRCA